MIQALIFDVDGTLAETEELHRAAFNAVFREEGLPWHWSQDDYRRLLGTTGGKERMRRHSVEIGTEIGDAGLKALHQRKTQIYNDMLAEGGLSLRPGVQALMLEARARGMRLAIATTTNRPNVDGLCQAIWKKPAEVVFDVIAAGDEVARKKPAPDVYLLALTRLGLSPDTVIAVEDSINGLRSAQAAGLKTVLAPATYTAHEDHSAADWLCADLSGWSLDCLNALAE